MLSICRFTLLSLCLSPGRLSCIDYKEGILHSLALHCVGQWNAPAGEWTEGEQGGWGVYSPASSVGAIIVPTTQASLCVMFQAKGLGVTSAAITSPEVLHSRPCFPYPTPCYIAFVQGSFIGLSSYCLCVSCQNPGKSLMMIMVIPGIVIITNTEHVPRPRTYDFYIYYFIWLFPKPIEGKCYDLN